MKFCIHTSEWHSISVKILHHEKLLLQNSKRFAKIYSTTLDDKELKHIWKVCNYKFRQRFKHWQTISSSILWHLKTFYPAAACVDITFSWVVAVIFKAQANNIIPSFDISRLERCSNRILLRRHPHCWCAIVPLNLLHSRKLPNNIATRSLQRFAVISCNNTYNTNFFHQIVGQQKQ